MLVLIWIEMMSCYIYYWWINVTTGISCII